MVTVNLEFSAENAARANTAIKGIYPIPQIPDPEWVDPEDGSTAPMVNEFTDLQWAKIQIRKFITRTTFRYERKEAVDTAADTIVEDDDIAT